jgi:glucose dehydrogenase
VRQPNITLLDDIYAKYCRHKQFASVMPIFASEYTDPHNDVIVYHHQQSVVAFSLLRRYDAHNVEAIQFAWDYAEPSLRLGMRSIEHECAYYKSRGYSYLYLGNADAYKTAIQGFEMLGPL